MKTKIKLNFQLARSEKEWRKQEATCCSDNIDDNNCESTDDMNVTSKKLKEVTGQDVMSVNISKYGRRNRQCKEARANCQED